MQDQHGLTANYQIIYGVRRVKKFERQKLQLARVSSQLKPNFVTVSVGEGDGGSKVDNRRIQYRRPRFLHTIAKLRTF